MVTKKSKEKPAKEAKKGLSAKDIEKELDIVEKEVSSLSGSTEKAQVQVKASKPIEKLKKGDKVKIDSLQLEVDAHYVLMDHGTTKEMALELFDSKTDKDYQVRYFSDQAEATLDLYELQEIIYLKKPFKTIEW